nr:hypothetical protein Iba_chr04fCG11030 [Ipomoea batatas]
MKRLTKSTVIGSKRKQQADNKVCSKEVSVRNVSNRTPLSAISSTPTANQATDLRMESLNGGHTHQTVGRSLKPSLRTPNTVFTNDLIMESLTGTHTHQRVGRVLQPSLRTPNSVLTNENVANNEPHIDAEVGPSTTHAGYTECITNLIKKPSSRLMNANNRSPSDCRNLHNDFNECSEQEDTVTDAQPGRGGESGLAWKRRQQLRQPGRRGGDSGNSGNLGGVEATAATPASLVGDLDSVGRQTIAAASTFFS